MGIKPPTPRNAGEGDGFRKWPKYRTGMRVTKGIPKQSRKENEKHETTSSVGQRTARRVSFGGWEVR